MLNILNPFANIEYIGEQYLFAIKCFKRIRPNTNINDIFKYIKKQPNLNAPKDINMVIQLDYINYCNEIFSLDETSKDIPDEIFDSILSDSELLKRIKPKQDMSTKEIKHQLKNCLAHANFMICYDSENPTQIPEYYINNKYIEGKITDSFIYAFFKKLEILKNNNSSIRKCGRLYIDQKNVNINNIYQLKEFIKNTKYIEFTTEANNINDVYNINKENKTVSEIAKELTENGKYKVSISEKNETATQEQINFIMKLLKYNGLKNFNNLNYSYKVELIGAIIHQDNLNYIIPKLFLSQRLQKSIFFNIDNTFNTPEKFLGPILYCKAIESLVNYLFCYCRETNEKLPKELQLRIDKINLTDIKIIDENKQEKTLYNYAIEKKYIKITDPLHNLKEKIIIQTKKIEKLKEDKIKKEKILKEIKNPKNKAKEEQKKKIAKECEDFLNSYLKELNDNILILELLKEELKTKENLKEFQPYLNTRNLFRLIRDSISHNPIIKIENILEKKELSNISFTFLNKDKEKHEEFKLTINAENLLKLCNNYKKAIIKEINEKNNNLFSKEVFCYSTNPILTTFKESQKELIPEPITNMEKNPLITAILGNSNIIPKKKKINFTNIIKATFNSKMINIKERIDYTNFMLITIKKMMTIYEQKEIKITPEIYDTIIEQVQMEWSKCYLYHLTGILNEETKKALR